MGSNYGPTIYVAQEAHRKGCQQVLWLFDKEEFLTEAGTMNILLVVKNKKGGESIIKKKNGNLDKYFLISLFKETELITPPLDGTILEGVTRQSILDMTRKWVSCKTLVSREGYPIYF